MSKVHPQPSQPNVANVIWTLIGAVTGASVILFAQRGHFTLLPQQTSYLDLAAVLLAGVSVLVAIFGGVFAILAFWGFRQIKTQSIEAAADAGTTEVKEQIENGPLRVYILGELDRIMQSDEFEIRLRQRIDEATFGSREDRELDGEEEEGQ